MAKRLPRSVYRAINQEMTPSFNRWARKNYGMSGKRLIAKVYAGEGGGSIDEGTAKRSSAGAWGPGQFIEETRNGYIKQYGVDPWKNDRSAVRGTMIHLRGTGVAGYNPGMPTYESYILGQKVDTRPLRTGRYGSGNNASGSRTRSTVRTVTPGIDNGPLRDQLKQQYLLERGQPDALLNLGLGLQGAEDVPGSVTTRRTDGVRTSGDGQPVMQMLRKAVKWDKAKVPYQWGGGHSRIAKPGEPVDCSGYVSAILGLKTPMVSGDLAKWGKPGKGRNVTVYASQSHVLIAIKDPRTGKARWFGTSRSNPGGGAGEIAPPSAAYLSSFAARHPA